jgi:hypothetical protein
MMEKSLTFLFSCNGEKPKQGSGMEKGSLTWVGMVVFFFLVHCLFHPKPRDFKDDKKLDMRQK